MVRLLILVFSILAGILFQPGEGSAEYLVLRGGPEAFAQNGLVLGFVADYEIADAGENDEEELAADYWSLQLRRNSPWPGCCKVHRHINKNVVGQQFVIFLLANLPPPALGFALRPQLVCL